MLNRRQFLNTGVKALGGLTFCSAEMLRRYCPSFFDFSEAARTAFIKRVKRARETAQPPMSREQLVEALAAKVGKEVNL
ncbi:MAG: hypothetical protein RIR83_616, partial [Pseudomonadota bacterium]